ncbi:MAG: helix-turn-helix domain-containing protein [Alphaproteobacteria bacterium]|nr:helix-turn-helix domain-containing protein [Alphaproteobacteria bacterium]
MKLAYLKPAPTLAEFFGDYYIFDAPCGGFQPLCAELGNIRIVLNGGGRILWRDGHATPFSPMTVVGPTMSAYGIDADRDARAVGVGLTPRGWDALFGFSAERLRDQATDFGACVAAPLRRLADDCRERLLAAATDGNIAACLDEFFMRALAPRRDRLRPFPVAIEDWLLSSDIAGIDCLVAELGVSRRQTDRLAKYYFGASPKALQRKYRTLHALNRLTIAPRGAIHWADACGERFYDQSHFIREFKQFVGATPSEYLADSAALMARSIQLRARATHKPARPSA